MKKIVILLSIHSKKSTLLLTSTLYQEEISVLVLCHYKGFGLNCIGQLRECHMKFGGFVSLEVEGYSPIRSYFH